jgi:hypothetical protein
MAIIKEGPDFLGLYDRGEDATAPAEAKNQCQDYNLAR